MIWHRGLTQLLTTAVVYLRIEDIVLASQAEVTLLQSAGYLFNHILVTCLNHTKFGRALSWAINDTKATSEVDKMNASWDTTSTHRKTDRCCYVDRLSNAV